MKFSEKIVKLRKMKGLTQDEFASAVGVSRQAVYKWESGQSYPEVAKLLEMKLLFNMSIDDLLDENYEVVMPEKPKRKRVGKKEKAEIEKKVNSEVATAEPAISTQSEAAPAATAEAPVYADMSENTAYVPEESEPAPAVAEEPIADEPVAEEPAKEAEPKAAEEKKRGFFARLFGRK